MIPIDLKELEKSLGCLIPRDGVAMPSCHEFSVCDCEVKQIISALKITTKALELYRGISGSDCENSTTKYSAADEALIKIQERITL